MSTLRAEAFGVSEHSLLERRVSLPFPSPVLRGGISLATFIIVDILLFTSKEVTDPDQLVALAGYAKGWSQPCHCPRR